MIKHVSEKTHTLKYTGATMGKNSSGIKIISICIAIASVLLFSGCSSSRSRYIDEGKQYIAAGNWDKSVIFFQDALKKHPTDTELKTLLARSKLSASISHMSIGKAMLDDAFYDEAIREFSLSIKFIPANLKAKSLFDKAKDMKASEYLVKKGRDNMRVKNYTQARDSFIKALKLNPENKDARDALEHFSKYEERPPEFRLNIKTTEPVSFKFKKTPIINVFEVLAKLSGINFIFDKDMKESRVTLFMTDVTFDRFIKVLLSTNSLAAKVVNDKTMIIYPDTPAKAKEYQDLQIRTFYLANLEAKKVVGLLSKILKSKDIIANETMNAVIIRGQKEVLEVASKIIEANDRPPSEVLLNVEILEVSRTKEKQLGLEIDPASVTVGMGEATSGVDNDVTLVGTASYYALKNITTKEIMVSLPTASLHLLKQDGETKILASPQVRVNNGEKATIHIGERIPLRTNRRVDTTGDVTYDYQYQDIGVKLDTVPTINMHGEVSLKLSLEVSALGPNVGTVDDPQYAIKTRTAKSVLTVLDGEAIIIGGLISDEERESVRKIPFLGDIPVLGRLFTSVGTNDVNTDILMSITPVITRSQTIPGTSVTHIWSGKEKKFSLKEPYESYMDRKNQYLDQPNEEYVKKFSAASTVDIQSPEPDPEESFSQPRIIGDETPAVLEDQMENNKSDPINKDPINDNPTEDKNDKKNHAGAGITRENNSWPETVPFSIHVNSLPHMNLAQVRIQELTRLKYPCFVVYAHVPGKGNFYRVFVGKFKDLGTAREVCNEYKDRKEFEKDIHPVSRKWALGG